MDEMDRAIARNIAKQVLIRTTTEDEDAAFRIEFADTLLARTQEGTEA